MLNKVTLCENALEPASWTTHDCDDVRRFLVDHFGEWPKTARIYLNRVGQDTDVTPYDEAGVERLAKLNGHFFVVVYPGWAATLLIVSIALSAVSLLLGYFLRPSLPENQANQSPTNSLTARQNKERLGGRIPDIYGTLWVTPDLIGVPYRIFIGNKEVEYSYLCIGRGEYDISQVRDDVTPIEQIDGAGCAIYAPYTSPNSGDDPQVSYGEPINEPIRNVKQYSSVNGQSLRAPNANKFKASNNVRFTDAGVVEGSGDTDFTDFFDAGSEANPSYLVIGNSDYDGTYLILDVNTTQIVLSDPGSVNAAWNSLSGETAYGSPTLLNSGDNFEGPYYVVDNTVNELWCNFVAAQGLYEVDSKGNQHAVSVTVQVEVTSIDNNYNAQGSPIYFQTTLKGSETLRTQCGATLIVNLPIAGSCKVRARRLTNTDLRDGWNVVDQVQWRDLYGVSPLEQTDFGNVTTLQTITWPTPQALSLKQRKINVLIGRKISGYPLLAFALPSVDFSDPDEAGDAPIDWELTDGGAIQHANSDPTILLSSSSFSNTDSPVVRGIFEPVGADNDFIGFVFHYQDAKHFYLFDWKGGDQNGTSGLAQRGMTVKRVSSSTTVGGGDLWPTVGTAKCVPLFHNLLQWQSDHVYNWELQLSPSGFTITISEGGSDLAVIEISDTTFTSGLFGLYCYSQLAEFSQYHGDQLATTQNAADIICEMALDPYIGRRQESEIDRSEIQAILGAGGEVETYFGTELCCQFSYAFDDAKMSFEEMVAQVCQATFCTAYRRGNLLSVFFEKETEDSTILFNHRNKLPGSETRTVKFGTVSENDGIDLDYIEPNAPAAQNIDSVMTLRFPTEESPSNIAVAPKKVNAIGVRNRVQAWMLGWRLYNKLLYQNTATQFDATAEAALCVNNERILVADNTRPDIQDGEVLAQVGLELTLSQPVVFASPAPNYTIFLQHYDATVEAIAITPGSAENKVVLAGAPSMALVMDAAKYARTAYMIVADGDQSASAFLLQEKDAKDGGQYGIKAINYDDRYYEHDQDYNASPRIIDVITPGDGTGSGYSAQASASVFVSGKTMPWVAADNPAYPFGIGDGKPPVVIALQAAEGETIAIAASAPGQPISVTGRFSALASALLGASNTVTATVGDHEWVDADGEDDQITGTNLDSGDGWSNKRFPTYYATSPALGHCCLMGAFAKLAGSPADHYEVIEVLAIGFGGNYTVPAGGVTHLLLGINDTKFSDNGGGFQVQVTQTGAAAGNAAAEDPEPDTTTADPNSTNYIFTANGV